MSRGRLLAGAVLGAAIAASGAGAATAPTPRVLVQKLLANPITNVQLPLGFNSATSSSGSPGAVERRHRIVGEVEVSINYGQTILLYAVFPTSQDALGEWQDANPGLQPGVKSQQPASGFPTPALSANGSTSQTDALNDTIATPFTALGFVDGNVVVTITNGSSTAPGDGGSMSHTLSLGRLALKHLQTIESKLGAS